MIPNPHGFDYNRDALVCNMRNNICKYMSTPQSISNNAVYYSFPKVVQKSYGQEKRFFCPAPQIFITEAYTLGLLAQCFVYGCSGGFINPRDTSGTESGMNPMPSYYQSSCPRDVTDIKDGFAINETPIQQSYFEENNTCTFKTIHFNDEQQRHIKIIIRILRPDGSTMGIFSSDPIKVISKPSKKKNVINRNTEMLIKPLSPIVFFSKVRTHAYSTRYLCVSDGSFISTSTRWSPLQIEFVGANMPPDSKTLYNDDFIAYGDTIKVVCPITGICLPDIIIYKVESYSLIKIPNENVSQLHRVALALKDEPSTFICVENESIKKRQILCANDQEIELPESACWSVVTTGRIEGKFLDYNYGPVSVTPIPKIFKIEEGFNFCRTLEIIGDNFSPDVLFFLGKTCLNTHYRDKFSVTCYIPDSLVQYMMEHEISALPFFLARMNGVIYPSQASYSICQHP